MHIFSLGQRLLADAVDCVDAVIAAFSQRECRAACLLKIIVWAVWDPVWIRVKAHALWNHDDEVFDSCDFSLPEIVNCYSHRDSVYGIFLAIQKSGVCLAFLFICANADRRLLDFHPNHHRAACVDSHGICVINAKMVKDLDILLLV